MLLKPTYHVKPLYDNGDDDDQPVNAGDDSPKISAWHYKSVERFKHDARV